METLTHEVGVWTKRRNFEFWDKLVIKNHVENQVTKEEKDKYGIVN
jgi:hypothetical protein